MSAISNDSIKSIACLCALPALLAIGIVLHISPITQTIFWLVGIGLLIGGFLFISRTLTEHNETWVFMIVGSVLLLVATGAFSYAVVMATGHQVDPDSQAIGNGLAAFAVAVGLLFSGISIYRNVTNLGAGDGIAVTIFQMFFALLILALALVFLYFLPGRQKSQNH